MQMDLMMLENCSTPSKKETLVDQEGSNLQSVFPPPVIWTCPPKTVTFPIRV